MNGSHCATGAFVCSTLAVLFCHAAIAVERPIAEPVRIALIGDSTVASYDKPPADRPTLTGWGQVFGEFFDDSVEISNFALSGRSSKSFLREGHWPKPLAAKPDYVFIQFGHNDEPGKGDRSTDPTGDYQELLGMVRAAAPQTRLGLMLPVPPAMSQDAFGANYVNGQTRWQYRRNQHRLVERMIDHYGGREQDGLDLVPTYVNLDCRRSYPTEREAVTADNGVQRIRQNNGVHPDVAGYNQIGDSLFAWLRSRTQKPN